MTQSLQKRDESPIAEFRRKINEGADKLAKWCQGDEVTPATLIRWAELAVQREPKFQDPRTWRSIFFALIQAAQLGLEPNGFAGDGWIVPYWNGKVKHNEAQFQPGYKGLVKLVRRSGEVKHLRSYVVLEGDEIAVPFNTELGRYDVHHTINLRDRGTEIVAAFSVAHLTDGSIDVEIVDAASIAKARAAGHGDTPAWKTWPDQMARKVAIRRHANQLPMSAVARRAFALDGALAAGELDRAREITETEQPDGFIDVTPEPEPQIHAVPELPAAEPGPAQAPATPAKGRSKAPAEKPAAPAAPPSSSAAEALKAKVRERRGKSKAAAEPAAAGPEAEAWGEGEAIEADYLRAEIKAGRITEEIRDRVRALEGDVKIELVLAIDEASGYGR